MKTGVIIQARMGSTRLSGKVMIELSGKTMLHHVIERVQQSELVDEIVIATTTHKRDDVIADEAVKCGVKVFRGDENDVLNRYYYAAKEYNIKVVIRIASDCPLIDPHVMDNIITYYLDGNYEIVTNASSDLSQRTYPRGLDVEVFSFDVLKNAFDHADKTYQREHVTPYIYENCKNIYFYKNDIDFSKYRWTLDTEEDLELITKVYERLYKGKHDFYLAQIVDLFNQNPELYHINEHVEQKKLQ